MGTPDTAAHHPVAGLDPHPHRRWRGDLSRGARGGDSRAHPGHISYVITSASGERLIAFGDAFHSPAQLAHPEWLSAADLNASAVMTARRQLLDELLQPNTFGFGVHFGDGASAA